MMIDNNRKKDDNRGEGNMLKWKKALRISRMFLLFLIVALFYPKYGKSEQDNLNDNTSGVVALLEVAKTLTPRYRGEVCFLFLDGGTQAS